jgi:hypothetical protein
LRQTATSQPEGQAHSPPDALARELDKVGWYDARALLLIAAVGPQPMHTLAGHEVT